MSYHLNRCATEHRDTEYELACDLIAECEQRAINSSTESNSAAQLSLLTLLAQLTQQPALTPQAAPSHVPRTDLTALLAQLAPLLSAPVTPVIGTSAQVTPLHVPTPVAAPPQAQLNDLNSVVQQLIQHELSALTEPSTGSTSTHDLLQSLLTTATKTTIQANNNVVNVRPTPQYTQQLHTTNANVNNTAGLMNALQTLLNASKPM